MPRPRKCRKVCALPSCTHFLPMPHDCGHEVVMSVDEYETIRLIDFEELTQEQCAVQMDIARTTVQAIYSGARKKLAECIVKGHRMRIAGGDVQICENSGRVHGCRRGRHCKFHEKRMETMSENMEQRRKVAVPYENGQVFQHFGRTERFKVYDLQNGKVQSSVILDTNGSGHGALAALLKQGGIDALICGGIGAGAKNALEAAGIALYGGVSGDTDRVVADFIANKLAFDSEAECGEHHQHDDCGHNHGDSGHGCHDDCSCHN